MILLMSGAMVLLWVYIAGLTWQVSRLERELEQKLKQLNALIDLEQKLSKLRRLTSTDSKASPDSTKEGESGE